MKLLNRAEALRRPGAPRLGAVFLVAGGAIAALAAVLPGPPDIRRPELVAVGIAAAGLGTVAWFLPWDRWPRWSSLLLLPVALTLLSVGNVFNGDAPYSYSSYYVVVYVWIGMAHPQWTSLKVLPFLVLSYLLPLIWLPGDFATDASSLMLVAPTCVAVGEILAWIRANLLHTEERLRSHSVELEDANRALVSRDRELRALLAELQRVEGQRRRLLDRTVDSLEEERKRIAVELHDGPIQHLTALDFGLETVRKRLEAGDRRGAFESLDRAQHLARGDVAALRHLMKGLRPPVLDEYGLATALREHADAVGRESGIEFGVHVHLPERLDPTLETVLYRVAQEAMTNVVKHSRADRSDVTVRTSGGEILLEVQDNGVGFRPEVVNGNGEMGHYGLMGMRQRVEMVGGSWEILPSDSGGTLIRVCVPGPSPRPATERETVSAAEGHAGSAQ